MDRLYWKHGGWFYANLFLFTLTGRCPLWSIHKTSLLVQVMTSRCIGTNLLAEKMITKFTDAYMHHSVSYIKISSHQSTHVYFIFSVQEIWAHPLWFVVWVMVSSIHSSLCSLLQMALLWCTLPFHTSLYVGCRIFSCCAGLETTWILAMAKCQASTVLPQMYQDYYYAVLHHGLAMTNLLLYISIISTLFLWHCGKMISRH